MMLSNELQDFLLERERIKKLALESGFKLKEQPHGIMNLNPYVYEFAFKLLGKSAHEIN